MKELLKKISSYNLFNYLFPGIIYVLVTREITAYDFAQKNIIIGIFMYYFIGLTISRVGSLIIEPFMKKIKFIKNVEYKYYISASSKDSKIDLLLEINNMYRTLVSLCVLVVLTKACEVLSVRWKISQDSLLLLAIVFLLFLFCFSYRKQTDYIVKRISCHKKEENEK